MNKGKRFLVNVATADDGAVGAGFAVGQLVMKSYTDSNWYVATASGSAGNVVFFPSQSALPFQSGPVYAQGQNTASIVGNMDFFEQNFPYQIVASTDGNAYQIYFTGTSPSVALTVSQSAYGKAYITNSYGAYISLAKPNLLLQNVTDGNYYTAYLSSSAGTTTLKVNQQMISQSWVHPIY